MTDTFTKLVKEEIESHIDKTYKVDIKMSSLNKVVIKKDLRIKFVKSGLVYDPSLGHHLEFSFKDIDDANMTLDELLSYGIIGKISLNQKRNRAIVYITDIDNIMKLLKLLGASSSLKIYKETVEYNDIVKSTTRKCNFDTANIHRSVKGAFRQLDDIDKLLKKKKIESLDEDLRIVINARKKYPDMSMTELAENICGITKNALNHRFLKIREMIKEK